MQSLLDEMYGQAYLAPVDWWDKIDLARTALATTPKEDRLGRIERDVADLGDRLDALEAKKGRKQNR